FHVTGVQTCALPISLLFRSAACATFAAMLAPAPSRNAVQGIAFDLGFPLTWYFRSVPLLTFDYFRSVGGPGLPFRSANGPLLPFRLLDVSVPVRRPTSVFRGFQVDHSVFPERAEHSAFQECGDLVSGDPCRAVRTRRHGQRSVLNDVAQCVPLLFRERAGVEPLSATHRFRCLFRGCVPERQVPDSQQVGPPRPSGVISPPRHDADDLGAVFTQDPSLRTGWAVVFRGHGASLYA